MKPLRLVLLLAATSCASAGPAPGDIVTLYDMARPDGVIELELERDGALREIEADIPVDAVPAHVLDAARKRAPGGVITGAEREFRGEGSGYEVKMTHDGRAWEFVFDDDGRLVETEKELFAREAPPEVLAAAETALPGSAFKSVELITHGASQEYHVKRTKDGVSHKMVIAPDGTLKRHVREARAELEIPIR